jgi:hypothetical protein
MTTRFSLARRARASRTQVSGAHVVSRFCRSIACIATLSLCATLVAAGFRHVEYDGQQSAESDLA